MTDDEDTHSSDGSVDEDDIFHESGLSSSGGEGEPIISEDHSASDDDSGSEDDSSDDEIRTGTEGDGDDIQRGGDVEHRIEGEFDRLIGSIRSKENVGSSSSMLSRIWDAPIADNLDEEDFRDDIRAASGVGRVGKARGKGKVKAKGKIRRAMHGPTLSHQVRALIGEGNHAYVDGNTTDAIRIMHEVIRIEPRAASAWSVLATCYRELGEPRKALQLAVMGAHLRHDAEEWESLAQQSRELGYNQQALYCYGKVASLDPMNVNALWERASLAKEIGDLKTARHAYLRILKRHPHDLGVLDAARHVLVELSDLSLCAALFQRAFEHYTTAYPAGCALPLSSSNPDSGMPAPVPGGGFAHMQILVLADLYNTLGSHEQAILVTRAGHRWLQGRTAQRFWDACPDDREFDVEGHVRDGSTVRLAQGFYNLDVNARHRLAIARLKLGEVDEGRLHADIILSQSLADYSPLFAELADAYFERGMYADARPVFELLGADASTSSMHVLLQAAACRRNLGDLRDAAEVYEHVVATDPSNNDAKMKLAEIYEITNEPRKALELVYQVIDSRKKRSAASSAPDPSTAPSTQQSHNAGMADLSLFEERKPRGRTKPGKAQQHRLTRAELEALEREKEREAQRAWKRVKQLGPSLRSGEQQRGSEAILEAENEWLLEAERLIESFRETRSLFVTTAPRPFHGAFRAVRKQGNTEADEENMASRLHLDLERDSLSRRARADGKGSVRGDAFRGIAFDDWLELFMQYAFVLTQRDQHDVAEDVLRHVLMSYVYQSRATQDTLRLALITCSIYAQKHALVMEHARKLIAAYQFNNEPLRLMLAALASGLRGTDAFIASPFQKHLFRELKMGAAAVSGRPLQWVPATRRYAPVQSGRAVEDEGDADEAEADVEDPGASVGAQSERFVIPDKPTRDNPITVAIYGQTCTAVKSYQSALFYLLHAYDYCPSDPLICLSLAVASMGRAMQRQADNRHYLITQSLGFLSQYRDLRGREDSPVADEIEFNFGRAFHQLGLLSHAASHYERVLTIAERRTVADVNDIGVAREAAYNLSLIYVTTGAPGLAQALYRRWLSL